ncbi:MAG: TetR/AcrR family transcriptional regulator [Deltaproteobacteria bacterium]|nr:TetR/AcrR family transcriptional regulator [Deltaproteobacteria bacterium]
MPKEDRQSSFETDARGRLLEAGTALFAERGYAGTTVQGVVGRAGVTKPVLYYYFESKAGLFRAILDRAGRMQEDLLVHIMEMPGSTLDRFLILYRSIYEGMAEHPDLFRLIHNLLFGPPAGIPPYDVMVFHRRMFAAVQRIYNEGVARGEVVEAEPDEVAMLVLGLMDFCFHHDQALGGVPDPCRPERLLRLTFQGLAARPR